MLESSLEWRGKAIAVSGRILEKMGNEPGSAAFDIGAQAHCVHTPADTAGMLERPPDQLVERVHEQLALTDRCEKRERGHDRLRRDAACDGFRDATGVKTPQSLSHGAELRRDRCFGNRRERAEGADAELAEAAMYVGVERQNGDGL